MRIITLLLALCISQSAYSAKSAFYQHEITSGYSFYGTSSAPTGTVSFGNLTVFSLQGGYAYGLSELFQLGGEIGITATNGNTSTTFVFLAKPKFNLNLPGDQGYQNAFYGAPFIGLMAAGSTGLVYGLEIGKRFKLFDHLSYAPSFGFTKQEGADVQLSLRLINLSVLF